MKELQYEIIKGETLISVPHNGKTITFVYEQHGPGTYAKVKNSIEQSGLATPTMAETVSFVHPAFFADESEFSEVRRIMKDKWLWAFTGTLYMPNKGAYIQDNPEIKKGSPFLDESELVKKLEANDNGVRFVPFGFKIGEMSPIKLAKNPYVIALAGEEGAEKLSEIADEYKKNPYLWSFDSVDNPLTAVSALDSGWLLVGDRLDVGGGTRGYYSSGCAFGVQKIGEASRTKK